MPYPRIGCSSESFAILFTRQCHLINSSMGYPVSLYICILHIYYLIASFLYIMHTFLRVDAHSCWYRINFVVCYDDKKCDPGLCQVILFSTTTAGWCILDTTWAASAIYLLHAHTHTHARTAVCTLARGHKWRVSTLTGMKKVVLLRNICIFGWSQV